PADVRQGAPLGCRGHGDPAAMPSAVTEACASNRVQTGPWSSPCTARRATPRRAWTDCETFAVRCEPLIRGALPAGLQSGGRSASLTHDRAANEGADHG